MHCDVCIFNFQPSLMEVAEVLRVKAIFNLGKVAPEVMAWFQKGPCLKLRLHDKKKLKFKNYLKVTYKEYRN